MGGRSCVLLIISLIFAFPSVFSANNPEWIEGKYIVVLHDHVDLHNHIHFINSSLSQTQEDKIHHIYAHALKGYAGSFSDTYIKHIKAHPDVKYVEQDQRMYLAAFETQTNVPTWGLPRMSINGARGSAALNTFSYPSQAGAGITAYIIDTGIYVDNEDFGGRATFGINFVGDGKDTDCHGHGTPCASTVGGTRYGVAKNVTLVAVKVYDCQGQGSTSISTAAIDWVTARMTKGKCVSNMSFGWAVSPTLDAAVENLIAAGCITAIAAGNSNADACTGSPARVPSGITVGATNDRDTRASFSSWGSCVDLFAPGEGITAAFIGSPTAATVMTGTSIAAPHVAGAAAVLLSTGVAYDQVKNQILNSATTNIDLGCETAACKQSPNKLLYLPYQ